MRLQVNDTVLVNNPDRVGIVERIDRTQILVRLPEDDNRRDPFQRSEVRPLAVLLQEMRSQGTRPWNGLNLNGKSTLPKLVSPFAYPPHRLPHTPPHTAPHLLRQP